MIKLRQALLAAASLAIGFTTAATAEAAIAINISQVGTSVVVTGSGSFDTTGLTRSTSGGTFYTGMNSSYALVRFGNAAEIGQVSTYDVTGPRNFGSTSFYSRATTAVGDSFGIFGDLSQVILPLNYVSGTALSGTLTFADSTFATLGLTAGTFNYANARDRLTVTIGNATPAVPEPASWAMMIVGVGMVGGAMRRRKSKVNTTVAYA